VTRENCIIGQLADLGSEFMVEIAESRPSADQDEVNAPKQVADFADI